jgi:CIC family chloride channel protein
MSGVMSGVLHAPLTAIFLIAEITSGYGLFIPLMLVSAIAYTTIYYFERNSIYTKTLIEKGELILHNKDLQVLSLLELKNLIEKNLLTIVPEASLRQLVELVKKSPRNIFPVVDEKGKLAGIITLDDIREIMFDAEMLDEIEISSLMHKPPAYIQVGDTMKGVMSKFETSGAWNLPVLKDDHYIGLISKSTIFNSYRNQLLQQAKD